MSSLRGILVPEAASKEERQPIMTPVERPESRSGRGNGGQEGVNGVELSPTNYNSVNTTPSSGVAALRDPEGGFVGPAATTVPSSNDPHHHNDDPPPYHHTTPPTTHHISADQSEDLWSWCQATSSSEKRLVLLVMFQMLVLIVLLCVLLLMVASKEDDRLNTCTSPECYKAVGDILQSIDEGVSPCTDFAEYVCGGWRREHPIPEAKHRWGVLDVLNEVTLLDLRGLLEDEGKGDANEPNAIKAVRTVYNACVNDSQWEEVGLGPLLDLLSTQGGLPMLDPSWTPPADFDPMLTQARLRRSLAGQSLVSVAVEADSANTSVNVIHVNPGLLPVSRGYLKEGEKHKGGQVGYMRRTGEALLREHDLAGNRTYLQTLYKDIDELWDFYIKIANITPEDDVNKPWEEYNPMTVRDLQNIADKAATESKVESVSWKNYLQAVFLETDVVISDDTRIIVTSPAFITAFIPLLRHTPPRILMNYLLFPLVVDMGEETATRLFYFTPKIRALGRLSTRTWYDCTQKVKIVLPLAVGGLYVRHRLKEDVNVKATEVVQDVMAAFRSTLSDAKWMDTNTSASALRKLDHMAQLVAFPALALNDTLMDEYHGDLPVLNSSDHFGNMVALTTWHCRRSLTLLSHPKPRDSWPRGPLSINAFYSPYQNSIVIPMAVLQPPLFIPERLTALNYGSLGSIIGHEVTHAFDNTGRLRDWTGALKHWWSNETLHQYTERAQCFVNQYSSYNLSHLLPPYLRHGKELKINGERTQGENIADNGGLRAAWAAYKEREALDWKAGRSPLKLPGLENFTQDQVFFIGMGKVWCSHLTPFAVHYILNNDVHSPGAYRVLATLQNSPEFAQAFNCPPNSPMNPATKCILW